MSREPIAMPEGAHHVLSPSLLSADFTRLGEEVKALEEGGADWLHVDVMDGRFVPNITIGVPVVAALRRITALPLDVHLMIVEPERYVEAFAEAGADILTVHLEASVHLHRTIQHIQACGMRAGVSLNPHSPLEPLEYVLDDLDLVLIMTVNPGFGGQRYIDACTTKVRRLRAMAKERGKALDIEVDGGVKVGNIGAIAQAGANCFVSGSGILKTEDYGRTMRSMREAILRAERKT